MAETSPSKVRGGASTAQRFSFIFSTQDGLSWHYNIVSCGLSCSHWGGGKSHMRPLAYASLTMMMMKRTVSMLMRLNDGRGPCVGHPGLAYCRRFRSGLVDVIDDRAVAFDLVYPTSCVVSRHHHPAQNNFSVESNQNVESKRQSVESKMGKWGVQLLAYLQLYI